MLLLLASYPKSGNTWLRALFSNYFSGLDTAVSVNALMGASILSQRFHLDEEMGIDSSNLTDDEVDIWRSNFCRSLAKEITAPTIIKVHDAYSFNQSNEALFPSDAVAAVIYPVRNPLQVCVSYAHHQNESIDWAIDQMADDDAVLFSPGGLQRQVRQKLSSWSGHVSSWLNQKAIPVHMVRYEDLTADTFDEFSKVISSIGLSVNDERVKFAIEMSNIGQLQQQEFENGFREKNPNAENFFRSGSVDDWKNHLNPDQANRIRNRHHAMMDRLGYL